MIVFKIERHYYVSRSLYTGVQFQENSFKGVCLLYRHSFRFVLGSTSEPSSAQTIIDFSFNFVPTRSSGSPAYRWNGNGRAERACVRARQPVRVGTPCGATRLQLNAQMTHHTLTHARAEGGVSV